MENITNKYTIIMKKRKKIVNTNVKNVKLTLEIV